MGVRGGRRVALVAILAAMSTVVALQPAQSASVLAFWQMSETSGSTMNDSTGNGLDGDIGPAVQIGRNEGGTTFFRWLFTRPEEYPPKPERLIQVPDERLNLGNAEFAISFRYRTSRPFGNIIQKGQAKTVGGQIKFQLPQGNVTCLIRGASGRRAVRSTGVYRDNQWHTVRCERHTNYILMTITDPAGTVVETKRLNGPTGTFSNRFPLTIGGKLECDQIEVTCDYFTGDIDWVKVEIL